MVGLTGEIARVAHCSVVLALGASKLESEPDAGGEAGGAHVPHRAHLAGAREEDLGPLVQPQAPLGAARAGGAAPAATQGRLRPVRRGESGKTPQCKSRTAQRGTLVSAAGSTVQSQKRILDGRDLIFFFF